MNKIDFLKKLNDYAVYGNLKDVIEELNNLFDAGKYKNNIDLVFVAIQATQLYGFLSYLTDEEISLFEKSSAIRSYSYSGNKIDYYNTGQLSLLNEIERNDKAFISAPTSFGKTSIISDYIIQNSNKFKQVIFIVPTNSLLEELYLKFIKYNKEFSLNYEITTQVIFSKEKKNILLLTPERFLILIESQPLSFFDLIIMDEAYKIVEYGNKTISDFINCRSLRFRKVSDIVAKSSAKTIFLSPYTYENTLSMQRFLAKHNIKKINREIEYVTHHIMPVLDSYTFKKYIDASGVGYQSKLSVANKVSLIINNLLEEKNIVYVSNYSSAYEIVEKISSFTIDKNNCLFDRYIKFIHHLKHNYQIDGYPKWKIIDGLEKGVGIYISPMPRYIKKEIIRLYEQGILHTLIVTTSFTEGVNTNAKNLIFTSLINGPTTNKLSEIDILNVSGRAGRFSKSSIGKIICITKEIYDAVSELQDKSKVALENYNYKISNISRIDYEIEMIDPEFLSENEKYIKNLINKEIMNLELSTTDLNISLNVSNQWKIILYKYFQSLEKDYLENIINAINNIISEDSINRIKSIELIFQQLIFAFDDKNINIFPNEVYEINPFSKKNKFTWGAMYKNYCSGSFKRMIKNNYDYITSIFKETINTIYKPTSKRSIEHLFIENKQSWILKYYKSDLTVNFNAFYSEAFKFISNVIQYKIPFYLSFFVSIFNLFIEKNNIAIDSKLKAEQIVMFFEDGAYDKNYSELIDFGLPHDLIVKLKVNKIDVSMIKDKSYNNLILDEYENILINDFISSYY